MKKRAMVALALAAGLLTACSMDGAQTTTQVAAADTTKAAEAAEAEKAENGEHKTIAGIVFQ